MAEVRNKGHMLWGRICTFLGGTQEGCKPQLYVSLAGSGPAGGVVLSVPMGIDCGDTCSGGFDSGTEVVLTAAARSGYKFDGWFGACSGTDVHCTITTDNNDKTVIATFSEVSNTVRYKAMQLLLPDAPTFIGLRGIAFNSSLDIVWARISSGADSYLYSNGRFYLFRVAGATITTSQALAINDKREIVGTFCDSELRVELAPYVFGDGCRIFVTTVGDVIGTPPQDDGVRYIVLSRVLHPDSRTFWFNPNGVNNNGDIVGFYEQYPDANDIGFLLSGGALTPFTPGGAQFVYPNGINDAKNSVGYACPDDCGPFLRRGDGSYGALPADLVNASDYAGINNAGMIVGNYRSGGSAPGFVISSGDRVADLPAFGPDTLFLGINNAGQIFGSYSGCGDASGAPVGCHFIATPVR